MSNKLTQTHQQSLREMITNFEEDLKDRENAIKDEKKEIFQLRGTINKLYGILGEKRPKQSKKKMTTGKLQLAFRTQEETLERDAS